MSKLLFYKNLYAAFQAIDNTDLEALKTIIHDLPAKEYFRFIQGTPWQDIPVNDIIQEHVWVDKPRELESLQAYVNRLKKSTINELRKKQQLPYIKQPNEDPIAFVMRRQEWASQPLETSYEPIINFFTTLLASSKDSNKIQDSFKHELAEEMEMNGHLPINSQVSIFTDNSTFKREALAVDLTLPVKQDEEAQDLIAIINWATLQRNFMKDKAGYAKNLELKLNYLLSSQDISNMLLAVNDKGDTPLHLAAAEGHYTIVAFILDRINTIALENNSLKNLLLAKNNQGFTPAEIAESNNHLFLARWLKLYQAYYQRIDAMHAGYYTLDPVNVIWDPNYKKDYGRKTLRSLDTVDRFYHKLYAKRMKRTFAGLLTIASPFIILLTLIGGPAIAGLIYFLIFPLMPLSAFIPVVVFTALPLLAATSISASIFSTAFIFQIGVAFTVAITTLEAVGHFIYDKLFKPLKYTIDDKILDIRNAFLKRSILKQLDKELAPIAQHLSKFLVQEINVCNPQDQTEAIYWQDDKKNRHCLLQSFKSLDEAEHNLDDQSKVESNILRF